MIAVATFVGVVAASGAAFSAEPDAAFNLQRGHDVDRWASAASKTAKRQRIPKVECLASGRQVYRAAPRRCTIYEHGSPGTVILASMKWRNWGKKRTRGRGTIHYFDHPEASGRVVVILRRIRKGECVPGRYYTAAHVRTVSGLAKGNVVDLTLAAGCPA